MMNRELADEVIRLGGDPTDPVWWWLIERGPHGGSFTWGQTRSSPPGYVGIEHLHRVVDENIRSDASFIGEARSVVALALRSEEPQIVRRAIQVAAVVGGEPELESIRLLTMHENAALAGDARASVFYLRKRLKAESE